MAPVKVAIAGATGNLGLPTVKAFLAAKYPVTVLTRAGSQSASKLPQDANLTVTEVDYESVSSLTSALKGIQVVVSTITTLAIGAQKPLIDAAVAAGVTRFIPSEFGSNTVNPNAAALPVLKPKVETQEYLKEKVKENPNFSYTLVLTGPFLDYGLDTGFVLSPKQHKATVVDGGDVPFSATTLPSIAKALVGVVQHLDETKNRAVYVHDATLTQNQLIAATKKKDGKDWDITPVSSDDILKSSYEELGKENGNITSAMFGFLTKAIYGKDYGCDFRGHLDNDLLGLKELSEQEIDDLVATYL